jgi:DNA adenine methylase
MQAAGETMYQARFFAEEQQRQIVNVASVPQRSPFRYPGGKTWLVPRIRQWFASLSAKPAELMEPFAGGASVGLAVAFEQLAGHVTLVERDEQVAAVWHTILSDDAAWLAQAVLHFDLTPASVKAVLGRTDLTQQEQALQTIIKNRVNRGGILAAGAGLLKEGENGKGLASRWYPETLSKRILAIAARKESIHFIPGDGLELLQQRTQQEGVAYFIDPPYTAGGKKSGKRLYIYSEVDHERLFVLASTLRGDFLMTYEDDEQVRRLAGRHGFNCEPIAMKNTHHAAMTELLIGRDLSWLRHPLQES